MLPDWQQVGPVQLIVLLVRSLKDGCSVVDSPLSTTLSPLSSTITRRWGSSRSRRTSRGRSRRSSSRLSTTGAVAEFALDESQSCLAVDRSVTLVHVGVVAGAAVGIGAVAVALDLACGLGCMLELMLILLNSWSVMPLTEHE